MAKKGPAVGATFEPDQVVLDLLDKVRECGSVAVCFFNNKGGVGKTTLVANLAAELALELNCKVLVVDADPQCNLTQYVLDDETFIQHYREISNPPSIYEVIHPLSIGKGYKRNLPVTRSESFGFDIVIGDPRLALKEDLLATDWRDAKSGGTRGLRTTFVFKDLIEKAHKYDFVFFDMGPSLGAINRSILLAVDYFVVPISIDIFSLWALQNIGTAVNLWQRELGVGLGMAEDPAEVPYQNSGQRIRFLGYVTQQHKERTEGGNRRIVEAYETISRKLPEEVSRNLGSLYDAATVEPHLGDIKHLASLAPKSQTLHTPMITVSVKGSYTSLRKHARDMYRGIAARFISNLAAMSESASRGQ